MLPQRLAFVDLETTGGSTTYNRIIEIGIVLVENDSVVDTFSTLLNPERYLPPEIERLTGITQHDVEHAPTFHAIAKDVFSMLKDFTFVAHNVRFDYGFLRSEFSRENISYASKHFCTVRLSRILYPQHRRHNLDSIIERYGFTCTNRHRALDDATVIKDFYHFAKKVFPEDHFINAVNLALRKPSLPPRLQNGKLDHLPEQPGVYIMYGENGIPLYVGKSINIKDRVLSHFTSDIHSATEMKISQQVESIETITTPGELGALILESATIKKLLPLYNKKLRIKRELIAIKNKKNKDGYETIVIEPVQTIKPDDILAGDDSREKIIGLFKSRRQAKSFLTHVAKEFALCERLLQLESTNTACFAYRLGNCHGACVGDELPIKYNMRFLQAFSEIKVKAWPFPGPIVIEEENHLTAEQQCFLIDKWCYLGSISSDTNGSAKQTLEEDVVFDVDLYKILFSYLKSPNKLKNVRQLTRLETTYSQEQNPSNL